MIAAGVVPHGKNERLIIAAISPDGRLIFAESQIGAGAPTLVMIRKPAWHRTVIQSMQGGTRLLGVAYDGRYVTYTQALATNSDQWVLWVWDSTSDAPPREIVRNAIDATGLAVPGPPNLPLIDHGRVFWVQGDQDGTDNLRMYTISSQTSKLIRRGHPGTPFTMGRLLLWPEMRNSGALTMLSAISLDTLRMARLPSVLASVASPTSICADADTVAWIDATMTDLYVWRTSWPAPRLGVRSPESQPLRHVNAAGSIVTWDNTKAQWALDLRTMTYAQIASGTGSTGAWGSDLVVSATAADAAPGDQSIVNASKLPPL